MRTAIISDIHGNLEGLQAVVADIEHMHCDQILCLGDLVDGGPNSVEVVRASRDLGILTVQGNHDYSARWDSSLPEDVRSYLRDLPEEIIEGDTIYTHTSPRVKKDKIHGVIEAWNVFEETNWSRIFVGDVHVAMILGRRCEQKVSATEYPIDYDKAFALDREDRYIVCPGAVGYSRDGCHRLRYVIYDDQRDSLQFRMPDGPILVF